MPDPNKSNAPRDALHFPVELRTFLEPYLPPSTSTPLPDGVFPHLTRPVIPQAYMPPLPPSPLPDGALPHLTLTYAQSLDGQISLEPGVPTPLSGPLSKSLTHFLRSRHDAILIGSGTGTADDPGLNCRLADSNHSPRPIILDTDAKWNVRESNVVQLAREGKGKKPWVFSSEFSGDPRCPEYTASKFANTLYDYENQDALENDQFVLFMVPSKVTGWGEGMEKRRLTWREVLLKLKKYGIQSVMVEGGGSIIRDLLDDEASRELIHSVIVTVAPVWLGQGGVSVTPKRTEAKMPVAKLKDVVWKQVGDDGIICGRIKAIHVENHQP